jgi:pimeloyl-ACP methyl ester carboxylesterase
MKKDNTPLTQRIVRTVYPVLEKVAPSLAHKWFIYIFFTPLRYKMPEKERDIAVKAALSSLVVNGKKVQIYLWGEGPMVLLVHGWAGRGTQFRKIIPALVKAGYRAVGFDGPAHGKSDGNQTNISDFSEVLSQLVKKEGKPVAAIAHSFGGAATLFGIINGLPIKRLINIASPTIGDGIIGNFLRALNASPASAKALKDYVLRTTGKDFDYFSALHSVRNLPNPISLLLIHDENDKDVFIEHPNALLKVYPQAEFLRTSGLGHARILRDQKVIDTCLKFIREGDL